MSKPVDITGKKEFNDEVVASTTKVLVDFWAPWCGPCQMMAPVLESLATKFEGKIKIVKLNTDLMENQELAMEYQISSIPNMKLFDNGKVVKDFIGYRNEEMFSKELEESI